MAKVHLLSPEIISKIAAGEVIERPASALKELIENALDSGTDSVDILLQNAGKTLIRIKDKGSGIAAEDLELIFQRHATSKISEIDDLYAIQSLGFRGEALYSLAAIADITVRSTAAGQDTGWEIHLRGGRTIQKKPVNMPRGTEVEVRELFFNTPARRKFLKANVTELHHLISVCIPYALIYPSRAFTVVHGTKTLLSLAPSPDHISRTADTLKIKKENLIFCRRDLPEEQCSIIMVLGDINIQRPKKDNQFIFINDRPVQNRTLNFHLNQAYRTIMPAESNPVFCVLIRIPPENVDVNIHPAKREVKLKDERRISLILRALCEQTLLEAGSPKQVRHSPCRAAGPKALPEQTEGEVHSPVREGNTFQYLLYPSEQARDLSFGRSRTDAGTDLKSKLKSGRYIGPLLKKYLLFESGSSLLIIDQHAAQERITYETLLEQIVKGSLEVQQLLSPLLLALSPREKVIWQAGQDHLEALGFSTTAWDEDTIAVHSAPVMISSPETAVRNLLSLDRDLELIDREALARRACRNSLMAGYEMIEDQAEFLRSRLLACSSPFTCPHGRPTVVELTEYSLDREFFRK